MRRGSAVFAVMILLASCKQQTMAEKHAAMDAAYLHALSGGKPCVFPKVPMLHRVEPVDARTACIVAAEAMKQIRDGKTALSGMPASYVDKIKDVFVTEISSTEVPEGLMWVGFWDAWIIPSGRKFPFSVRFDRDTREVSMGFCGECIITKEVSDSMYRAYADSIARDSVRRDTALHAKRGVVTPIKK